eukprot:TRINITY_DN4584_c0_g1_i1.p2 TRINITY_DN4584_c0_g1~~TRINITY_DN4584_c0_g1_i1.p2  ORF type:complete len:174 (+),score=26.95 TRINITY_DN4584_c0_g1_i1:800-1321(+)
MMSGGRVSVFRATRWDGDSFLMGETSRFPAGLKTIDGADIVGGMSLPKGSFFCPFSPPDIAWDILPSGFIVRPIVPGVSCTLTHYLMVDVKQIPPMMMIKNCSLVKSAVVCCARRFSEDQQRLLAQQPQQASLPPAELAGPAACKFRLMYWLGQQLRKLCGKPRCSFSCSSSK